MGSQVPAYGKRPLPAYIDEQAQSRPDHPLYLIPRTANVADGYDTITIRALANAINRTAWWIEQTIGKSESLETIGYIGPSDIRYYILIVASTKAGYKILISSPRNSLEGHLSLIEKSNCRKWLIPAGTNIDFILDKAGDVQKFAIPEVAELLDATPAKGYPYVKPFEQATREPWLLLHTSGSTGLPKPITIYHGTVTALDAYHLLPGFKDRKVTPVAWKGASIFSSLPPFHSAGLAFGLFGAFYFDFTIVWPTPGPITVKTVVEAIDYAKPNGAFIAPSTLEEITKSPDALERLTKLDWITSGGGPISEHVGEITITKTNLWPTIGMTESHWYAGFPTDSEDWSYFHFHPDAGFDMQPRADGLFELVHVRKPEMELMQPAFKTFPHLDEWPTQDLFSPHPTKPWHWKYAGRGDDIIVLSNGEKFNPIAMEGAVTTHPLVTSALVVGQGRFQTALILELAPGVSGSHDEIVDQVWPTVEACNEEAPAHAHVDRLHIMIATPEKPFPRASKGTVQRRPSLILYAQEIDDLYTQADLHAMETVDELAVTDEQSIRAGISKMVHDITKAADVSDDADFFALGMDSLQVLNLQRTLRAALRDREGRIDQKLIYAHPSVSRLSKLVWQHIQSAGGLSGGEDRVHEMEAVVSKYATTLTKPTSAASSRTSVVVTGTTGSLGSYLLDALLLDPQVAHVWCLNRSADAAERQTKLAEERGLQRDWSSKVTFLHADLAAPRLGLTESDYDKLSQEVSHIIHNSWRVDFNLSLSSFEPQVAGVSNLIQLCCDAAHAVTFLFISSIGVAQNWPSADLVPEARLADLAAASGGYGESKLVAERLLEAAAQQGVLDSRVCRVGQIAGPVKLGSDVGMWNRNEWLPTIIDTSAKLSLLPSTLGSNDTIDWIPVDMLSEIITRLALQPTTPSPETSYFHAINPHKSTWAAVLPAVQAQIEATTHTKLSVVSLADWVAALRRVARAHRSAAATPAAVVPGTKLVDFYDLLVAPAARPPVVFELAQTTQRSAGMRALRPVGDEWMRCWLTQWGYGSGNARSQ